jgi:copper(I)-binding protein
VSRIQRFRPTGAAVFTGAVIGAIALAGCSAGQITQTGSQQPAVVGANAGTGPVVVRDAHIEFGEQAQGANIYPRGGAAPLRMSIVNSGGLADRLVSASSPAAASVQISGEAEIPSGRVLLIEGGPAAATGGGAQRPDEAPATPRAGTGGAEAGGHEAQIVLTGLKEDVRAGLTYPLVLNFERAGQITMSVPVGFPSEPREDEPAE